MESRVLAHSKGKKAAHKFNSFTLNSRAILVGPAGFGEPRPKNSPPDCFYPARRGAPSTGCSNSAYLQLNITKKMQPPARLHLGNMKNSVYS